MKKRLLFSLGLILAVSTLWGQLPAPFIRNIAPKDGAASLVWSRINSPNLFFYRVFADTVANPTKVVYESSPGQSTDTVATIGNLINGKLYYVKVAGVDFNNTTGALSAAKQVTPKDLTPPAPPQMLVATPMNGVVKLSWNANTDSDFKRYRVYMATEPDVFTAVQYTTTNNFTVSALSNNTMYWFRVTAYDIAGNQSQASNVVVSTPRPTESEPNNTSAEASPLTGMLAASFESAFDGQNNAINDVDMYNAWLDSGVTYHVVVMPDNDKNPISASYIKVYDNANILLSSVQSDNVGMSHLWFTSNASGTYHFEVSSNVINIGDYTVALTSFAPDTYEPNNTWTTAAPTISDFYYQGLTFHKQSDVDFYSFDGTINQTMTLNWFGYNMAHVALYNQQGRAIAHASTGEWGSSLNWYLPETGKFYLKVSTMEQQPQRYAFRYKLQSTNDLTASPLYTTGWTESLDANTLPNGWLSFNYDQNNNAWTYIASGGFETSAAWLVGANDMQSNDWLVLPSLDIKTANELTFYVKTSTNIYEHIELWQADATATSSTAFTRFWADSLMSTTPMQVVADLSAFAATKKRIAIRVVTRNGSTLLVDQVMLGNIKPTAKVTGKLTDSKTSAVIPVATVQIGDMTATTDSSGVYTFNRLPLGTTNISFAKTGYQSATFTANLVAGNNTANFKLLPLTQTVVKQSNLELTDDLGISDNPITDGWAVRGTFVNGNQTINPAQGNSMIVFGGENSFPNNVQAFWGLNSKFDLSNYTNAWVAFSYRTNVGTGDRLYPAIMDINEKSNFLDVDGTGDANFADHYTGNSGAWKRDTLSLQSFCNLQTGKGLRFGFLMISDNNYVLSQWGVAIDSIIIWGMKGQQLVPPQNLVASMFKTTGIDLAWTKSAGAASYGVFRAPANTINYELIAKVTTNSYTDANAAMQTSYQYKVTAISAYTQSTLSDFAYGEAGTPSMVIPSTATPYFENFENGNTIPQGWRVYNDVAQRYLWQTGVASNYNGLTTKFPQSSRFLFVQDLDNTDKNYEGSTLVTTPWFDVSNVTANFALLFQSYSRVAPAEKHYIVYRTMDNNDLQWHILDSIQGSDNWQNFRVVLDVANLNTAQFGFLFENAQTSQMLWGLDSVSVLDLPFGGLKGTIKTKSGKALLGARVYIPEANVETFTDASGNYSFLPSTANRLPLYGGQSYTVQVSAFQYNDTTVANYVLAANTTKTLNFVLQMKMPAPRDLNLTYNTQAQAVIKWKAPEPVNLIQFDVNSVSAIEPAQSTTWRSFFEVTRPMPDIFKLTGFHFAVGHGIAGVQFSYIKIYNLDDNGDTIKYFLGYKIKLDSLYDDAEYDFVWAGAKFNAIVDTSNFIVEYKLSKKLNFVRDYVSPNAQQAFVGGKWVDEPWPIMLRANFDVGGQFNNLYSVYKKTTGQFALIAETADPEYTDQNIGLGQKAQYLVRANYSNGLSDASNVVIYDINTLPYLDDSQSLSFENTVEPDIQTVQQSFDLSNIGLNNLNYSLHYHAGYTPQLSGQLHLGLQEGTTWARLRTYASQPQVGDTATINIYLENEYLVPNFWALLVEITAPVGVKIIGSTDMMMLGGSYEGGNYLKTNQATGNGVTLQWLSNNSNIVSDEVALAQIKVVVLPEFSGEMTFEYRVEGDIPYHELNEVKGNLKFTEIPYQVNFNTPTATIAPSESKTINASVKTNGNAFGFYPGYIELVSNAVNKPNYYIPFNLHVKRHEHSISGLITNAQTGSELENVWLMLTDTLNERFSFYATSDAGGRYQFNGVTDGAYRLTVLRPDYVDAYTNLTINHAAGDIVRNISLQPDLRRPSNTKATATATKVNLSWEPRTFDIYDPLDGADGDAVNAWKVIDNDNDGNQWTIREAEWAHSGGSFLAIDANVNGNNDWLISPSLKLTPYSVLSFWIRNEATDGAYIFEEFNVKISTSTANVAAFGEPVFSYKFEKGVNWKRVEIPLGQFANATQAFVAIQCVSVDQYRLAIDDIRITELRQIPTGLSPQYSNNYTLQNFFILRSTDGQLFETIDTVGANTLSFADVTAQAGVEYHYAIQAGYNIGRSLRSDMAMAKIVNQAPVIAQVADQTVEEDKSITLALPLTDPNGDNGLTFTLDPVIERFQITSAGKNVTITPNPDWNGASRIEVVATDGFLTDTMSFRLSVTPVNDAPQITSENAAQAVATKAFTFQITATDVDADMLTYTIANLPTWLTLDAATGSLSGTPSASDATIALNVTVSDGTVQATQTLTITVSQPNVAPAFTSQPITLAERTKTYTYNIVASDANGDSLIFVPIIKPSWLTLTQTGKTTATLTGTVPNIAQDTIVQVSVTDGFGIFVNQTYLLNVTSVGLPGIKVETLQVYPTISAGKFSIILPANANNATVKVFNTHGQLLHQSNASGTLTSLDLTAQPEGLYWIHLTTPVGNAVSKVIIQK